MCIDRHLKEMAATLPPDAPVMLTRRDIEWLRTQHCGRCDCAAEGAGTPKRRVHRPESLAIIFGVGKSTARGWIRDGKFGDPTLLQPHGSGYEVPDERVEEALERQKTGWKFIKGAWIEPVAVEPVGEPATGGGAGAAGRGADRPPLPDPPRRTPAGAKLDRERTRGIYSAWAD